VSAVRDKLEEELGARAVGGVEIDGRDVPVAFAASQEQVVLLLLLASAQGWSVLPIGSGTKLERGPARARPRFAISLRGLSGVTAYERGDGTISARAGSTMAALRDVARAGGNHLTPDVAQPGHATLGGTLAAGASGIDRLRYGPVRHHVLGMTVALADGSVTKTGGRLVKNVTGYDLHRLYTGSRGALCVILEASLRLFPAPERDIVLRATYFGRDAALAAARQTLATSARPTCVCVDGGIDGQWTLTIALVGRADPIEWERATIERIIGDCEKLEGAAARDALGTLRDREPGTTLRASVLPGGSTAVLAALDVALAAHRARAALVIHPGIASVDVNLLDERDDDLLDEPDDARAELVLAIARGLIIAGADVELRRAPLRARASFDPLESVPAPARALMSRLKSSLDPAGRFAAGAVRT
jgi:glycolate oxidase FAD binding subunit